MIFGIENQETVTRRTILSVEVTVITVGACARPRATARANAAHAPEVADGKPARSVPPDSNMAALFVCSEVLSLASSRP